MTDTSVISGTLLFSGRNFATNKGAPLSASSCDIATVIYLQGDRASVLVFDFIIVIAAVDETAFFAFAQVGPGGIVWFLGCAARTIIVKDSNFYFFKPNLVIDKDDRYLFGIGCIKLCNLVFFDLRSHIFIVFGGTMRRGFIFLTFKTKGQVSAA